MALQELSPPPPITAGTSLASALLNTSGQYAHNARQDQLIDSQRKREDQLRLEDRAYQETRDVTQRRGRLEDDATLQRQRATEAGLQVLINEGLLDPAQRNDQAAITAAYQTAKQNGLEKMYADLLTVPGPGGKPLLTIADLNDKAKVDAAKGVYNQMRATTLQRELDLPGRMTEDANSVAAQFQKVSEEENGVLRQLQEVDHVLETGGAPTQNEVQAKALQLATAQKIAENQKRFGISRALTGDKIVPSDSEIQAQIPAAMELSRTMKLETALSRQDGLRRQLEGVRAIRQSLAQQQNTLRQQKAYPTRGGSGVLIDPTTAPAPVRPPASPTGSPMSGFLQQLEQEAARSQPAPASAPVPVAPPPSAGLTPGPVAAPVSPGVPPSQYVRELAPGSPEEAAARAQILSRQEESSGPLFPNAIWNWRNRDQLRDPGLDPSMDQTSSQPGRPITPSASIFPTAPWWSRAG